MSSAGVQCAVRCGRAVVAVVVATPTRVAFVFVVVSFIEIYLKLEKS